MIRTTRRQRPSAEQNSEDQRPRPFLSYKLLCRWIPKHAWRRTLKQGSKRSSCDALESLVLNSPSPSPLTRKWTSSKSESVVWSRRFVLRSLWSSICRRIWEKSGPTFLLDRWIILRIFKFIRFSYSDTLSELSMVVVAKNEFITDNSHKIIHFCFTNIHERNSLHRLFQETEKIIEHPYS